MLEAKPALCLVAEGHCCDASVIPLRNAASCSLNRYHYAGIGCCVLGIALVGTSSMLSGECAAKMHYVCVQHLATCFPGPLSVPEQMYPLAPTPMASKCAGEGSASHPVSQEAMLLGMGLIIARWAAFEQGGPSNSGGCIIRDVTALRHFDCRPRFLAPSATCSQCVQAAQITFEDFFMADLAIPPLKIVGYEGVLGAATMLLLVLPIVQVRLHLRRSMPSQHHAFLLLHVCCHHDAAVAPIHSAVAPGSCSGCLASMARVCTKTRSTLGT